MSGREARPRSPERLALLHLDHAGFDDDGLLTVTATITYSPWCCAGPHELIDAVVAVGETFAEAAERAQRDRDEALAVGLDAPSYPYPKED